MKATSFKVVYNGEVVKGDDTYLKMLVKGDTKFVLVSGGYEPKLWKRFPTFQMNSYFWMSTSYWDAVVFKPKIDVAFLGFTFFQHYGLKDFKLKFKYSIDGVDSEEKDIDMV